MNISVCEFSELSPGGQNCSGRGVCLSGECVCQGNNVGISDFSLESKDCDVNLKFAKFCWFLFSFIVSIVHVLLLLRYKRLYSLAFKKQLIYYTACSLGGFMFAFLGSWKLRDLSDDGQSRVIGEDPVATILFSWAVFFWWLGAILFLKRLAELFMSQLSVFPNLKKKGEIPDYPFLLLVAWSFTFSVFFPMMCLANENNCAVYAGFHHVGLGLLTAVFSLYYNRVYVNNLIPYFQMMMDPLKRSSQLNSSSEEMIDVLTEMIWKLDLQKRIGMWLLGPSSVIYGMFGVWPFLLRRSTYVIGLGFAGVAIMTTFLNLFMGYELRRAASRSRDAARLGKIAKAVGDVTKHAVENMTFDRVLEEEKPNDRISSVHFRQKRLGLFNLFRGERKVWQSRSLRSQWASETKKIIESTSESTKETSQNESAKNRTFAMTSHTGGSLVTSESVESGKIGISINKGP
eukprot:CAMPEP_0184009602 /NCGR_PEP_ID=MMETSP0954-20121128/2704_1 /TAXON_ID=627963 /ORGANISM="Aplanochytrium sp, Strain PBS07" /LENGTH=458 /DNA_ID=CAMNT_0026289009 /DNA_START=189 /DNA_END=1561 /DNA_ORIENTATION=-